VSRRRFGLAAAALAAAHWPAFRAARAAGGGPTAATLAAGAATGAAFRPAFPAAPRRFAFAVIADTPYNALEERALAQVLADFDDGIRFVLHLGDLKSGWEPCSDELLERRAALIGAARAPLVYVPGDNEWVDCARGGHDPLERLDWLRRRFQSGRDGSWGTLGVEQQSRSSPSAGLPENLRWRCEGALFLTLNLPGSRNGLAAGAALAAHNEHRHAANEAWLRAGFALAEREHLPVLVVAVHANPGFERDGEAGWTRNARPPGDDPYARFRDLLRELVALYPGSVTLLHGDTHRFRHDRPLRDARGLPAPRLQRVEAFGSPYSMSWVRIEVDAGAQTPLRVETRRVEPAASEPGSR
jgi:hypothetical protein